VIGMMLKPLRWH